MVDKAELPPINFGTIEAFVIDERQCAPQAWLEVTLRPDQIDKIADAVVAKLKEPTNEPR